MVQLLFAPLVEASLGVHQQLYAAVPRDPGADRRLVVPTTCADVILCSDQEFRHRFGSEVSWHDKMPDFVAPEVRDLSWAVALMPVSGDQNPSALADSWKEGCVERPDIGRDILFVYAISKTSFVELVNNFRAVPILVEVKGEIRQPFL